MLRKNDVFGYEITLTFESENHQKIQNMTDALAFFMEMLILLESNLKSYTDLVFSYPPLSVCPGRKSKALDGFSVFVPTLVHGSRVEP